MRKCSKSYLYLAAETEGLLVLNKVKEEFVVLDKLVLDLAAVRV